MLGDVTKCDVSQPPNAPDAYVTSVTLRHLPHRGRRSPAVAAGLPRYFRCYTRCTYWAFPPYVCATANLCSIETTTVNFLLLAGQLTCLNDPNTGALLLLRDENYKTIRSRDLSNKDSILIYAEVSRTQRIKFEIYHPCFVHKKRGCCMLYLDASFSADYANRRDALVVRHLSMELFGKGGRNNMACDCNRARPPQLARVNTGRNKSRMAKIKYAKLQTKNLKIVKCASMLEQKAKVRKAAQLQDASQRDAAISRLSRRTRKSSGNLHQLLKLLEQQRRTIAEQQQTIDGQQRTITEQQQTIDGQQRTITEQQQTIDEQQQRIEQQSGLLPQCENGEEQRILACLTWLCQPVFSEDRPQPNCNHNQSHNRSEKQPDFGYSQQSANLRQPQPKPIENDNQAQLKTPHRVKSTAAVSITNVITTQQNQQQQQLLPLQNQQQQQQLPQKQHEQHQDQRKQQQQLLHHQQQQLADELATDVLLSAPRPARFVEIVALPSERGRQPQLNGAQYQLT